MVSRISDSLNSYENGVQFIVRDVYHGNMNEIKVGRIRIFFDMGADKYIKTSEKDILLSTLNIKETEELYIIISHWDVDHYHFLESLTDTEFRQIKLLVAPNCIPSTETAKRVFERLYSCRIVQEYIPEQTKRRSGKEVELISIYSDSKIELFRATRTKSRNLNCIVVLLKTEECDILLTGDTHYNKLFQDIIIDRGSYKPLLFMVPHHGGNAGEFNSTNWRTVTDSQAIISYNIRNSYGHPSPNKVKFRNLSNWSLVETNGSGDKCYEITFQNECK